MTVLQGNMHRCEEAHLLLPQIATEHDADVLILSEQYRDMTIPTWFRNDTGTSAIWVRNSRTRVIDSGAGDDYVWARVSGLTYVSVYLTPNCPAGAFEEKVDRLEDALRDLPGDLIVAGDLNSRAIEWGMTRTDRRGRLLLEMAARLNLTVANSGCVPTYIRPGVGSSIPDVTMISDTIVPLMRRWKVIDDYTASDHQYIVFDVTRSTPTRRDGSAWAPRWNVHKLDNDRFSRVLLEAGAPIEAVPDELTGRRKTERLVDETLKLTLRLCKASMPRKSTRQNKRATYWWSDEIAQVRRLCIQAKRRMYRARERNKPYVAALTIQYKTARKTLTNTIKNSKKRCWRQLCDEVDGDPWGLGYKIVTQRLGARGPPELKDATTMGRIVDGLFPNHPTRGEVTDANDRRDVPVFTEDELIEATASLKAGKAPGPDGVPGEVLRLMARLRPGILLDMYNECLKTGTVSTRWKTARLVLLSKGKGEPHMPSSYRPLSLLDTTGKVFELLLRPRLTEAIGAAGGLSDSQHGFRKGRSTIGAIRKVIETVRRTDDACHAARPLVILVTLDVRNAFNSARWVDILGALEDTLRIPPYLSRVLRDYLKDRHITYETEDGQVTRSITAGVAQGSILGPDLWNVTYDSLLRLEIPSNASLVAYADDVAAVIVERSADLAQLTLNQVMRRVDRWMTEHGLTLALDKTEVLMLTRRRVPTIIPVFVGTEHTETRGEVKYLGITLDTKLTFWPHIKRTAERAAAKVASLTRLMANTHGPKPSTRRLLMSTAHSILLYGAEVWADALTIKKYRKTMTYVQRQGALRIACAYRTVPAEAVLIVAGVIPIDLLAMERKRIYERDEQTERPDAARREREKTLTDWHARWTTEGSGRWTRRLIKDLRPWTERGFGEVNFYLTQFLTGHGYFRSYLHNMKRVQTPNCKYCGHVRDDVEHTFFTCDRWTVLRQQLEDRTGNITPDNIVGLMLRDEDCWTRIDTFVETVLRRKRDDGCLENE